jgi:hypothetical protein
MEMDNPEIPQSTNSAQQTLINYVSVIVQANERAICIKSFKLGEMIERFFFLWGTLFSVWIYHWIDAVIL